MRFYTRRLFTREEGYIAAFPCGRFIQQEDETDLWAVSIAMEWRNAWSTERRIGLSTGKIRQFPAEKSYRLDSLEVVNPSGVDREFVERMLQTSRPAEKTAENGAK